MTDKPTYWENNEPREMADVRDYWHPELSPTVVDIATQPDGECK